MKDVFTHGTVHPRDAIPAVHGLRKLTHISIEASVCFRSNLRIYTLLIYVLYRRLDEADDSRVLLTVFACLQSPQPPVKR